MLLERRTFLAMSSITGATGMAGGATPGDAAIREVYDGLRDAVGAMPAFNNHMHMENPEETLAWFFPGQVVGRSNEGSKGLAEGLQALLDLPQDALSPAETDTLKERYAAFCAANTLQDYYHRIGDVTNTVEFAFITTPGAAHNKILPSARLKLVMHVDHYLFPLDNAPAKAAHPSRAIRLGMAEHSLAIEGRNHGPAPAGFADYLAWVRQAIKAHADNPNVIGGKWGFSYWRSFDIQPVDKTEAQRSFESRDNSPAAYKQLQDFLAAYVLRTCAELKLPLQIHTGLGADPGLVLADSNPALLDRLLSQPDVAEARVACLHGGYPFCTEVGVMGNRPHVWIDFSWMVLLLPPRILARYLREWIEMAGPARILFGVDGAGLAQIPGSWCARRALAWALAGMVADESVTEAEALGIAQGILRGNARRFYGMDNNT